MSQSKVIVLGTNLEGLLAGHAATLAGRDVYFIEETDVPGGLDFLAAPIPMTVADAVPLRVELVGDEPFFYQKLSGTGSGKKIELPFGDSNGLPVWNPLQVFEQLTEIYGRFFHSPGDSGIDPELVGSLASDAQIISAVQMPAICKEVDDHTFSWAGLVRMPAVQNPDGHTISLSGDLDHPWAIQGATFFGSYKIYNVHDKPPVSEDKIVRDFLPLKTNCDCWPDVLKVSDAAQWNSKYPTHRAFYRTFDTLDC